MQPVRRITGTALPLDRADVDTDQIIPKQFLKRIERTGFGPFLFYDWAKDPGFVLNQPQYEGASILLAGPNFGCGSSREHAPWAIEDRGFKAVVAPSFADIFRSNCTKIGLLPVTLPDETVRALMDMVQRDPKTEITVDLETQTVTASDVGGVGGAARRRRPTGGDPDANAPPYRAGPPLIKATFEFDRFTRWRLVEGLDDIGLTERHEDAVAAYEERRAPWMPTTVA